MSRRLQVLDNDAFEIQARMVTANMYSHMQIIAEKTNGPHDFS
jgi:hypothetical protein